MSTGKLLIPPAAVPLALWVFGALAGRGAGVEINSGTGSTPAADAGSGADGVDGGDVGADSSADVDGTAAESSGNGNGCEEVLLERAQAQTALEGHVADGEKPAGGVNGNLNALDKQCGGAFVEGSQEGAPPPARQRGTDPGKSGR